jgi:hypothetical protein
MNSLRPLILITPCIIPRLLWTCLRISYPRSYHAIIVSVASFFRKFENVLCVAFLNPSGTLSLVKYPVLIKPNILPLLY